MSESRRRFLRNLAAAMAGLGGLGPIPPRVLGQALRRPRGMALSIGIDRVNPLHYAGWSDPLYGCGDDVEMVSRIARDRGFETRALRSGQATREAVIAAIRAAAGIAQGGDLFLLHYSGHGTQVPDRNGDENDGQDEAFCLYDGLLIDDEMRGLWAEFAAGVRVLVLADSCHSGTVASGAAAYSDAAHPKASRFQKTGFVAPPLQGPMSYPSGLHQGQSAAGPDEPVRPGPAPSPATVPAPLISGRRNRPLRRSRGRPPSPVRACRPSAAPRTTWTRGRSALGGCRIICTDQPVTAPSPNSFP